MYFLCDLYCEDKLCLFVYFYNKVCFWEIVYIFCGEKIEILKEVFIYIVFDNFKYYILKIKEIWL